MKKSRVIISLLCVVFIISTIFNTVTFAAPTWSVSTNGTCGKNNTSIATWKMMSATNPETINNVRDYERIVISGTGETEDYSLYTNGRTNSPWYDIIWDTNSIVVEEGITRIGNNFFIGADSICYLSLPNSLQSIGDYAFSSALKYVKKVTIPENVTTIGQYAFCSNEITEVEILGNVSVLQESVFSSCKSLKTVTIPKSVTEIQDYAFDYCTSLADIYYDGTRAEWEEISIGYGNSYLLNATVHFPTVNVESVALDKSSKTMFVGSSFTLTPTILPENADNKTISWKSSNSSVATVNNGVVTAISPGTATVTVTTADGNKTATCVVSVQASTVSVSSITLNKSKLELQVGETETLVATVIPTDATTKTVTWSTSNANVATVVNGKITPKSEGTAIITATTVDGGMTATCEVVVKGANIPVESVALDKNSLRLWTGDTATLQATIYPLNASNKNISWASSNESVATVDNAGNIKAKSKGSTTITVTTNDGDKVASCVINVHYGVTVDEFKIWKTNYGTQYLTSEEVYYKNHILDVSWSPVISRMSDYSDYDMYSIVVFEIVSDTGETYTTSCQPYYAPYNSHSQQLKYSVPAGKTYTIKATLRLGYTEGYYFVEKGVYESNTITINLSSCSYYKTSFDDEYLAKAANCGSPAKYYANCQYCGVNYNKFFTRGEINSENHECGEWEYVDEYYHSRTCECGNVMETGEHNYINGICQYCNSEDPNKEPTVPVESVVLNKNHLSLKIGETETLIATISPNNATDKTLTWKSTNENIVSVTDGVVKAISAGTATITVSTIDENEMAECVVVVEERKPSSGGGSGDEPSVESTKVTIESVACRAGSTISVPITISNNVGLAGLQFLCSYDNALSLIKIDKGEALQGLEFTVPGDLTANPITLLWDGMNADNTNGEIVILTFKIDEDAEIGDYAITLTTKTACDQNLDDVALEIVNGSVSVIAYTPGDVNEDNDIDTKDIILTRRFVAGGYGASILEAAADVDANGEINSKDIILMRRFIAGGYGVELK